MCLLELKTAEQIMIQNIVWQDRKWMEIFNSFNNYWNNFAMMDKCD